MKEFSGLKVRMNWRLRWTPSPCCPHPPNCLAWGRSAMSGWDFEWMRTSAVWAASIWAFILLFLMTCSLCWCLVSRKQSWASDLDTKIVTLSHCNRPLVTLCSCSDVAVSTFCYSISINKNGSDYMNKLTHVRRTQKKSCTLPGRLLFWPADKKKHRKFNRRKTDWPQV